MAVERRLSFGGAAARYDRMRPSYPSELVEDVLAFACLAAEDLAVEVGAGTGKATALFAARGIALTAIEPSGEMAVLARRNCAPYPRVQVVQADFESWEPAGGTCGLVYAAQAWHWVRPEVRYVKARRILRSGGTLAAFWNRPDWSSCALSGEIDEQYRELAPEMLADAGPMRPGESATPLLWGDPAGDIRAAGGYESPVPRSYRWRRDYSTEQYLELLQTHSDHIMLEPERRRVLMAALAAVIDRAGGQLQLDYVTQLTLARATGASVTDARSTEPASSHPTTR
jgi:SAM-dependent methyltransferase